MSHLFLSRLYLASSLLHCAKIHVRTATSSSQPAMGIKSGIRSTGRARYASPPVSRAIVAAETPLYEPEIESDIRS